MTEHDEGVVEELNRLFAAAQPRRGTSARQDTLSATMNVLIEDYAATFLTTARSLTTNKVLSKNSQDSYKSGLVSALLKSRRGEKLTSDENSYTRFFERYVELLKEFNEDDDEVVDES